MKDQETPPAAAQARRRVVSLRLPETDPLYASLCLYADSRGWTVAHAADHVLRMALLSLVIGADLD